MLGFFDRSVLGLDIGSHSIKLVELKKTRGEPTLTCAKAFSIGHETEPTATDLRRVLDISNVSSKRTITALSSAEEQVIMRSIFIPDMTSDVSEDALETGVTFEAEAQDYIPYEIDNAVMNFDVIGEGTLDNSEEGLIVYLVSAPRDLVNRRIQLLRDVGLTPYAIDIDILAIPRLLKFTNQISDDEEVVIIDIGAFKTSLCFYQKGEPYIYPHIKIAGDELTYGLSQQLQLSWEKAEKNKVFNTGSKNPNQKESSSFRTDLGTNLDSSSNDEDNMESREYTSDEISEVLQRILEKNDGLCSQLQLRFEDYEVNYPKPSKIILSGGTSQLVFLDEFIESRIEIPVERVSYLEKISVDTDGDVSDIEDNEPLFATALGLALKYFQ